MLRCFLGNLIGWWMEREQELMLTQGSPSVLNFGLLFSEVVSSKKCNETCNPTSSQNGANTCGGHDGSISAYTYTVVASNSLAIEVKNFRSENVSDMDVPVMTGEVGLQILH